jgi:hypothetical protein
VHTQCPKPTDAHSGGGGGGGGGGGENDDDDDDDDDAPLDAEVHADGSALELPTSHATEGADGLDASVVEAADPGADGGGGGRGEDKRHSRSLDSFPDLESPRSGPSPQTLGRGGDVK